MPRPGVLTFELPEEFSDEALIGKEHLEDNYHRKMVPSGYVKIAIEHGHL